MHYTCIACITIDSVMKVNKKNYLQVYLEECKYKIKEIHDELESNSDSESDLELDSEELMAKLESNSDPNSE